MRSKMPKHPINRNKTIRLDENEIEYYLRLCPCSYAPQQTENMVIHADAFDVLKTLPDSFVDLLIVDPPYNLNKRYGTRLFRKMRCEDYAEFTHNWIVAVRHTLKATATIYVCSDWRTSLILGLVLSKFFTIHNRITWQREKGRGTVRNWKNSMEDIWFATVSSKEFTFNADSVKMRRRVIAPYKIDGNPRDWTESQSGKFRDTFPSNFWDDISVPDWSMPENTDHPTQKPEKLFAKLILASSNPGDMLLDPFAGSGTSAVVAKKLGRRFVAIEREDKYCAYALRRLETADTNQSIQGYTDGVFWERNTFAEQQNLADKGKISRAARYSGRENYEDMSTIKRD
jgi:site-specific DNA-methyltransferase (adenine-specific)